MKNKTQTKEDMSKQITFNEWAKNTKFATLWAPDLDEILFYQDHEERKRVYQEVKDLPKIDYTEKPFVDVLVESIARILRIKQQ